MTCDLVFPPPGGAVSDGAARGGPGRSLDGLHVDLDVFDGPFDLLVTLILRDEVDIWEIHVSRIVAEYILRLAESEEFDLEATSHFIVLVAALLEMKSRRLLDAGSPFVDELAELDEEAAGEELLDTLLRFARFKGAAGRLGELFAEHAGRLYRRRPCRSASCAPRAPGRPCRPPRSPARSACCSPSRQPRRQPHHRHRRHAGRRAAPVARPAGRRGKLHVLGGGARDRLEKAVTFFALLELHNSGEVSLRQPRPFAEITVTRTARPAPAHRP